MTARNHTRKTHIRLLAAQIIFRHGCLESANQLDTLVALVAHFALGAIKNRLGLGHKRLPVLSRDTVGAFYVTHTFGELASQWVGFVAHLQTGGVEHLC
jgi:hypothetical protein